MPFDALIGSKPSLATHLAAHGIAAAVPMEVLQCHKALQLRRHRPNPFATPYPYVLVGGLAIAATLFSIWHEMTEISFINAINTVMALLSGPSAALVLFLIVLFCCEASGIRSIRGKAQWVEKQLDLRHFRCRYPRPIEDVIDQVAGRPDVNLIYGELVQNRKVLDPYIVIEVDGEQACLGIWEDQHVIACARIA